MSGTARTTVHVQVDSDVHERYLRMLFVLRLDQQFKTSLTEVVEALMRLGPIDPLRLMALVEEARGVGQARVR